MSVSQLSQSNRGGNPAQKAAQLKQTLEGLHEEKRSIQDKLKNQNQTSEAITNLKQELQILNNNMDTIQYKLEKTQDIWRIVKFWYPTQFEISQVFNGVLTIVYVK